MNKKEFMMDDRVRFIKALDFTGLTGQVLGKSFISPITDTYIVLLDVPTKDRKAICISESCLERI